MKHNGGDHFLNDEDSDGISIGSDSDSSSGGGVNGDVAIHIEASAGANGAIAASHMSPSSCAVLIVDKQFLKGVYYTTENGGTGTTSNTGTATAPVHRMGPALDDVVFVQELLEIYNQVVAVVSGDTALRWIFNHTGNRTIIVLIDVDETYGHAGDSTGPIYTPPASPSDREEDSLEPSASGPYGLALLRVIAHYAAIGVFRNVAPIAMSASRDPSFMRQAASFGAMNYLIKPVSAQTVHSLWLNVFSCPHAGAGSSSSNSNSNSNSNGMHKNMNGMGDSSSLAAQQSIFQRRIRTDTFNGAPTADTRNPSFEEDFIRQFIPSIAATIPLGSAETPKDNPVQPMINGFSLDFGLERDEAYQEGSAHGPEYDFISSPRAERLRAHLLEWSFCPYEISNADLIDSVVIMVLDSARCVDLSLCPKRVRKFVTILESAYYDNPYHNFHHAIDVTQCTYYILHVLGVFNKNGMRRSSLRSPTDTSFPVRNILRPTDALALVVASLCHDLGHPGLNNAFMVRAHTQLAELYNDQSVLENFHAACFSMIMSYFFTDFLSHPPASSASTAHFDYEEFRRIAVHAILATDMARHFEFIEKCKDQHRRFSSGSVLPMTPQQQEDERAQLASIIIKCADISNIVRPFSVSQRWTKRLNREVTLQGDIEESLGLSRSILVDEENIPSSQISFYAGCGRPLFSAVADLVPELRFMPDQLENNIRNWEFIKTNQKVPEIPYGLTQTSTFDASSTRPGSTDSAPDFIRKRSMATVASSIPYTISTMTVSNDVPNYTLHTGGTHSKITVGDDYLVGSAEQQQQQQQKSQHPALPSKDELDRVVPSPPNSHRSPAAPAPATMATAAAAAATSI